MASFERPEIQTILTQAVIDGLKAAGIAPTPEHVRRATRSLIRIAAKMTLENGGTSQFFLGNCRDAFVKESGPESHGPVDFIAP